MTPRKISLLIVVLISLGSSLVFYLISTPDWLELAIGFSISFLISYALLMFFLNRLFFNPLQETERLMARMKTDQSSTASTNVLDALNNDLVEYLDQSQAEINRLKQLENFRREFLADISHELKTPLFAAQGFVHTLLDGAIKDKAVRDKFLKKAARSLDGLDILVQDLLTISQIESGSITMHFEHFNIVPLTMQLIDQMEGKAEKRGITIELKNDPDEEIYVFADSRRIYQVLANLLSNALKYSKRDKIVSISFKETLISISCSVKDRGFGIPEEDLGRIFERFYRVDKSRSKEKGGTGLGLAIVKHIIEGHGAKMKVKSKLKKGSTFSFELNKGEKQEISEDVEND